MADKKGFSSGPKYSAGWWFGKNSWWSQSGARERVTGQPSGDQKGWLKGLGLNVTHDIPDDQKLIVYGVIGLVVYRIFIN